MYNKSKEVSRGSFWKDLLFGKKRVEVPQYGRGPGMTAQDLQKYISLLKEHNERQERRHKKGKMRRKMKSQKFGNV